MADAIRSTDDRRGGALVGWLALALASAFGAAIVHYLQPRILLALARTYGGAGLPAGLELYLGTNWMLWLLPALALASGLLSLRLRFLRRAWLIGLTGSLFVGAFGCALGLLGTFFLLVNSAFDGGQLMNRFPPVAEAIMKEGTRVRLLRFGNGIDSTEFHGRGVVQEVAMEIDAAEEFLKSLLDDVAASDGRAALCFDPGFGVQVESASGSLDLLLCYECQKLEYRLGEDSDRLEFTGESLRHVEAAFAPSATPKSEP